MGILIQYILGVFILRLEFGYALFQFLGQEVSTFLDYTDNGAALVFGDKYTDHFFAFKVNLLLIILTLKLFLKKLILKQGYARGNIFFGHRKHTLLFWRYSICLA